VSKWLEVANLFALLMIFVVAGKEYILPYASKIYYANDYKRLMFRCDNVMRDHFIAKNKVLNEINDENIKNLESAEIGLVECHDYDKLRKKLLIIGLSDYELGELGLEAIEENAKDVQLFVKTHEIKY